jgi:hypothetical protein
MVVIRLWVGIKEIKTLKQVVGGNAISNWAILGYGTGMGEGEGGAGVLQTSGIPIS